MPTTLKLDFLDSVPIGGAPGVYNSSSALVIRVVCGWPDGGLIVILWGSRLISFMLSWSCGEEYFYMLQTPRHEPSTIATCGVWGLSMREKSVDGEKNVIFV